MKLRARIAMRPGRVRDVRSDVRESEGVSTGILIIIIQTILGIAAMALNVLYWWRVVGRWEARFRRRCERRYGVVIKLAGRGSWDVEGDRPWHQRLGIELLQLAYFMGALLVWIAAVVLVIIMMWLLE